MNLPAALFASNLTALNYRTRNTTRLIRSHMDLAANTASSANKLPKKLPFKLETTAYTKF